MGAPHYRCSLIGQLLFVLVALLTAGHSLAAKLPIWVENPIADTDQYFYGVGQGSSLNNGTQAALESVAGKLLTQIESDLAIKISLQDNIVSEKVDSVIRSSVSNTSLSNYEITKVKQVKKDYWVQVAVGKNELRQSNLADFNGLNSKLDARMDGLENQSVLDLLPQTNKLREQIDAVEGKLLTVRALDSKFDSMRHMNKLTNYRTALDKKVNTLVVYVTSDLATSKLADKIAHELANAGYRTTRNKPPNKYAQLMLKGEFTEALQFNNKYVHGEIVAIVTNEMGEAHSEKQLKAEGRSLTSHANAKIVAFNRLMQELAIEGVAKSLGL